jgi:5-methylcytosine-specific restriction endonuclease McrA
MRPLGSRCFYCLTPIEGEAITLEHFLAKSICGIHRLENLTLACKPCNWEAGVLPVAEKLELAIRKRGLR